jgi:hypothetical protein
MWPAGVSCQQRVTLRRRFSRVECPLPLIYRRKLSNRFRPVRAEPANMNIWPLSGGGAERLNDRLGEGFRMPAIAGGASGHGPAYGNRPCTNPRAASTASMGI